MHIYLFFIFIILYIHISCKRCFVLSCLVLYYIALLFFVIIYLIIPMSDPIYQVSTGVLIESPLLLSSCQERIWRSVNHIVALANFITDAAFCLGCVLFTVSKLLI